MRGAALGLIVVTLLASWLGMQQVHESGHVLTAWWTGGAVERVVLNPVSFSRTDLVSNPSPLAVAWGGPVFGVLFPLAVWGLAEKLRVSSAFLLRFFAGFCLIANGAYLGFGAWDRIGDCGELLRHGAENWQLWAFGAVTIPTGLRLWHRQATSFGIGREPAPVSPRLFLGALGVLAVLLALALASTWLFPE